MVVRKGRGCPEDLGASSETRRGETGAEDKVCGAVRGASGCRACAGSGGLEQREVREGGGLCSQEQPSLWEEQSSRGREAKGWAQGRAGFARHSRTLEGPISLGTGGTRPVPRGRGTWSRGGRRCPEQGLGRGPRPPAGGGQPFSQRAVRLPGLKDKGRRGQGKELVAGSLMAPKKTP